MKKIRIVEQFVSIQGEGVYVGTPSLFVRLFGCNFTCSGFSNPDLKPIGDIPLKDITSVSQLDGNAFTQGCDSRYAWHKDYKHLSPPVDWEHALQSIKDQLDKSKVKHIVWTGGEPLMNQAFVFWAISNLSKDGASYIHTIETNGSLSLLSSIKEQELYLGKDKRLLNKNKLLFSVSPKLAHSGEPLDKRFNVSAFVSYLEFKRDYAPNVDLSFKFVCGNREHIEEAIGFVEELCHSVMYIHSSKDLHNMAFDILQNMYSHVSIMPLGATVEQYQELSKQIADLCVEYNLRFSPRLHLNLYGNAVGT